MRVACLLFTLLTVGCRSDITMSFDTLEYQIGDMPEAPQTLVVNRLGRARYTSHTNRETFERPEMGIYETVLPAEADRAGPAGSERWHAC